MGLIQLQGVKKQLGGRVVLDGLTLELHSGEKVGLVGPNGAGKTTIFKLITGLLTPERGTVTLSRGLNVGYLPQEPQIEAGRTLHDEVLSAFADLLELEKKLHELSKEMESATPGAALDDLMGRYDRTNAEFVAGGGYNYEQRLEAILHGLGFSPGDYLKPMTVLSGGQKCRAALAKLLLAESQFLLLDEPTNHLDIDAVRWLEKFLANHHGGAVIISHDRYLLDRVADRIVAVDGGSAKSYAGNYSAYIKQRELDRLTQEREYEKNKDFIEKEKAFIAKHMGSQRTAEAKGRRTRLERRLKAGEFTLEKPGEQRRVSIRFEEDGESSLAGRDVVEIAELAKAYGEHKLFAGLSMKVPADQRLGITGPNGTGKSTLLKILLGQVQADAGTWRIEPKATVGYFAQDTGDLDPQRTVVEEILTVRPELKEPGARSYAARFLFRDDDAFKLIGLLSGGEQSRVRLMKLILSSPQLLILDEPTNHLDIQSREVLEDALLDFAGTIIAVSHDRYFLDQLCNRLMVIRPEGHAIYDGNYSEYIEQVEEERTAAEMAATKAKTATQKAQKDAKPSKAKSRFAKMKFEEIEKFIIERESKLEEVNERFADPKLYADAAAVTKLKQELDAIKAELKEAEAEWYLRGEQA
jgi:ATP-binding cassette subfamily F protein 3